MRGKPLGELSRLLLTRGLWFIALELCFFRFLIFFNADVTTMLSMLQVIWAIGWSLIVLAAIIHLPMRAIVLWASRRSRCTTRSMAFRSPRSPVPARPSPASARRCGNPARARTDLSVRQHGPIVFVLYPLVHGLASCGPGTGRIVYTSRTRRRRALLRAGPRSLLASSSSAPSTCTVNLRIGRAEHADEDFSLVPGLSKYPPSLLYLMMTLGPALIFLGLFDRDDPGVVSRLFVTFGRVPLFFYCLQWFVSHSLAIVAVKLAGKPTDYLFSNLVIGPPPPPGTGFGLPTVYALWSLRRPDLSAVRVVRGSESAPARLVAELPLRARSFVGSRVGARGLGIRGSDLGSGYRGFRLWPGRSTESRQLMAPSLLVLSGPPQSPAAPRARPGRPRRSENPA